jgi:hypothetical protein
LLWERAGGVLATSWPYCTCIGYMYKVKLWLKNDLQIYVIDGRVPTVAWNTNVTFFVTLEPTVPTLVSLLPQTELEPSKAYRARDPTAKINNMYSLSVFLKPFLFFFVPSRCVGRNWHWRMSSSVITTPTNSVHKNPGLMKKGSKKTDWELVMYKVRIVVQSQTHMKSGFFQPVKLAQLGTFYS